VLSNFELYQPLVNWRARHVEIDDANGGAALWTGSSGLHAGKVVTSWVLPSQSTMPASIKINFDDHNYTTYQCTPTCSCQAATPPSTYGAIVEAYEYRRYQTGATPYALPMRLAGQYYDDWETDVADNQHRYYDPTVGQYLQPEPALAIDAHGYESAARRGRISPAYAYAAGNPITGGDPSGAFPSGCRIACNVDLFLLGPCANVAFVCGVVGGVPGCDKTCNKLYDLCNKAVEVCVKICPGGDTGGAGLAP